MSAGELRDHIRDIPDFPKPGIVFRDITPLLRSPEQGAKTPAWLALLPPEDRRTGGIYRDEQETDW